MRVAVLGHRGMLGSVVAQYLEQQGCEVATTDLRYDGSDELPLWAAEHGHVVNCISKGRLEASLSAHIVALRGMVVMPSTDAIGEDTEYAMHKRIAEQADAIVLRSGIVDITRQPTIAYPEWMLNPLTPLEWAREAFYALQFPSGIRTLGGDPIDRYSLAVMVADIFGGEPPILGHAPAKSRVLKVTHHRYIRDALLEYRAWLQS
jgi:hypothetical protein